MGVDRLVGATGGIKPSLEAQLFAVSRGVRSKLKCPVFVASEMSGFIVEPSPIGVG